MRLKSVIMYNLDIAKRSMLIFYGIIAALLLLLSTLVISVASNDANISNGGIDMSSCIFLFVVGLNSFKQNYLFLSTNGISRRTQFYGMVVSMLPVTVFMAAIDTLIGNVMPHVINYKSMFFQIYRRISDGSAITIVINFLWCIALYLFAVMVGYFITTLYYRMSTLLKTIVSIGVPALFFIGIPTVDFHLNEGRFIKFAGNLFTSLLGVKNGDAPLVAAVSFITLAAVFAGLTYLLVRRAPIKEY